MKVNSYFLIYSSAADYAGEKGMLDGVDGVNVIG